jgi:CheY-like chemotaxis protein
MGTVLIVDDNAFFSAVMEKSFGGEEYEILKASRGEEAMAIVEKIKDPVVVLLDWEMPEMTGMDFLVQLRTMSFEVRPYVIMVTSRNDKESMVEALEAGADDYLPKPMDRAELTARTRVGFRQLDLVMELQKRLAELEAMSSRNELLGEMVSATAEKVVKEVGTDPDSYPLMAGPPETENVLDWLVAPAQRVLQGLSLGTGQVTGEPAVFEDPVLGWAGVGIGGTGTWIDIRLEADLESARDIYTHSTGKEPASDDLLYDIMTELTSQVVGHFKTRLGEQDYEMVAPLVPASLRKPPKGQARSQQVVLDSDFGPIALAATCTRSSIEFRDVRSLAVGDLLQDNIYDPNNPEIILLKGGTILNERYMERLRSYGIMSDKDEPLKVRIVKMSPWARAADLITG